jgi:hypothetical protein
MALLIGHMALIARLFEDARYELPDSVSKDMRSFIEAATAEADYDPRQFKVGMTPGDVANRLRAAYRL